MSQADAQQHTSANAPTGDNTVILSEALAQQYTLGAFYSRLRAQVEHENSLYDRRMMWLVTLQAILFATIGFVIGGFLSKDIFDLKIGIPQTAIIAPVTVFVMLVCFAGMFTGMACYRTLSQAMDVNKEIGKLWMEQRKNIFDFEQLHLRAPRMKYEDAIAMFPHPRGGWKMDEVMERQVPFFRTRYIPLIFVFIWGISLLMVFGGLWWILTEVVDPPPVLSGSTERVFA